MHDRLEPISKSPKEDNEASELYEAEEVLGVVFPTDEDAALPLNPSKEALHEPASHIAAQPSPILRTLRRGLSDLEAELEQLAMNARRSPQGDFPRSSAGSTRAVPHRSSGDLRESGISNASTDETRLDANAQESRAG
jgi:hypothetical protein